jgi:uridine kinase
MKGDSIVIEDHHRKAAKQIVSVLLPMINDSEGKFALNVAGESGSGKSEIATAIANELEREGIRSVLLQQDDYFVYPPKTNDRTRRKDIDWVGPQEVHLDVMDQNIRDILDGAEEIEKPLVIYEEDSITRETIRAGDAKVIIADGTYTTMLKNLNARTFIDRTFTDTRKHRERRMRDDSELDEFIDKVLGIEHQIISSHKPMVDLIISKDYEVSRNTN